MADVLDAEVPSVPLMYGVRILVHAWRVADVELDAVGTPAFSDMRLVEG